MIDTGAAKATIALYEKHGWKLSRVLLTEETRAEIDPSALGLDETADIRDSDLDAFWFTRRSDPGSEAWELRRLVGTPFALVIVVEDAHREDLEDLLAETEHRMIETLHRRDLASPNGIKSAETGEKQ